mgnify:CR=1 FL=1
MAACADLPARRRRLRKQAVTAADSVVLNIAGGCGRRNDSARNHFEIARGSAGEACAVLDVVTLDGADVQQDKLRRVGAMLTVMCR